MKSAKKKEFVLPSKKQLVVIAKDFVKEELCYEIDTAFAMLSSMKSCPYKDAECALLGLIIDIVYKHDSMPDDIYLFLFGKKQGNYLSEIYSMSVLGIEGRKKKAGHHA